MKYYVERSRFRCSTDRIEIIITYACNMRCTNCDAMCTQAPTNERMSLEQIDEFISESIEVNKKWKHIRVLGGEPTTHKEFDTILSRLLWYKNNFSPDTVIQVVTNGYGDFVNNKIKEIPPEVEIENSNKTSNHQPHFSQINNAPVDEMGKNHDYSDGCWITSLCGMTLDSAGFYPCSVAASTARVAGFDDSIKQLKNCTQDLMEGLLSKYCRYCGHYPDRVNGILNRDIVSDEDVNTFEGLHKMVSKTNVDNADSNASRPIISPSWDGILKKYEKTRPTRKKYGKVK